MKQKKPTKESAFFLKIHKAEWKSTNTFFFFFFKKVQHSEENTQR